MAWVYVEENQVLNLDYVETFWVSQNVITFFTEGEKYYKNFSSEKSAKITFQQIADELT